MRVRLTQSLDRAARLKPGSTAVIDGTTVRNWAETRERVARVAGGLRDMGLKDGDRVGILANNSVRYLESYYAVLWAGGVAVPFNTRLAEPELRFQMDDADIGVLIFGTDYADTAAILARSVLRRPNLVALDGPQAESRSDFERLAATGRDIAESLRNGDDLACLFFTGGTTGVPKGVMLSHQNLHAMSANMALSLNIGSDCVNLHSAPMFHVSAVGIFFTTMLCGVHVFAPNLAPETLLPLIARHRVTHCFTVPAVIDRLVKHPVDPTLDFSSLQILGYGGSAMPVALIDETRRRFPGVGLAHGYGMTEIPALTMLGPDDHRPDADRGRLRSVGRPMFDYEIRIVGEDDEPVQPGQFGQIVGRGPNLMLGYWNRPSETAEALKGGWMHSGDVGRFDEDGFLYVSDRIKDMIVSGAENVYSIEVEDVIYRHPAVEECAVVGLPDPVWGERVHAIVRNRSGESLNGEALLAFCRQHIAGYKCPKTFEFRTTPLPRSAIGKVLKAELRRQGAEPAALAG